jgi:hypothetical protein
MQGVRSTTLTLATGWGRSRRTPQAAMRSWLDAPQAAARAADVALAPERMRMHAQTGCKVSLDVPLCQPSSSPQNTPMPPLHVPRSPAQRPASAPLHSMHLLDCLTRRNAAVSPPTP